MIEYFNQHPEQFWYAAGFSLFILEALVFGFSSGVVLFSGIGALVTGGLIHLGILEPTLRAGISSFGISSALITMLLWIPFRRLQGKASEGKDQSSDLIGHQFRLEQNITRTTTGTTRYSGVDWVVELDPSLSVKSVDAGSMVQVVSVEVAHFVVKPVVLLE